MTQPATTPEGMIIQDLPRGDRSDMSTADKYARFAELKSCLLACDKGEYSSVFPGFDGMSEEEKTRTIRTNVQAWVNESIALIHDFQSTTATGPKGRKTANTPKKAKSLDDL